MAARRSSPCASSADTSHEGPRAMTIRMNWREEAACGDADPDLFFPIGTTGNALRQIDEANESAASALCKSSAWPGRWKTASQMACGEAPRRTSGVRSAAFREERELIRKRTMVKLIAEQGTENMEYVRRSLRHEQPAHPGPPDPAVCPPPAGRQPPSGRSLPRRPVPDREHLVDAQQVQHPGLPLAADPAASRCLPGSWPSWPPSPAFSSTPNRRSAGSLRQLSAAPPARISGR